jgi:hypothetical protein
MAMDTFDLSFDLGLDLWSFIVGKILFLGTVKIRILLAIKTKNTFTLNAKVFL